MNPTEIKRRFEYIPPTPKKRVVHERMRKLLGDFAVVIDKLPGESREKSAAITKLEESAFWVHAHISRNLVSTGGVAIPPVTMPVLGTPLDEGVELFPGDGAAEAEDGPPTFDVADNPDVTNDEE